MSLVGIVESFLGENDKLDNFEVSKLVYGPKWVTGLLTHDLLKIKRSSWRHIIYTWMCQLSKYSLLTQTFIWFHLSSNRRSRLLPPNNRRCPYRTSALAC